MINKKMFSNTKCFIMDIDGTVSLGSKLFDGSSDTIKAMKKQGKTVCLFTNNSSLSRVDYLKKISGMGLDTNDFSLYTSAIATCQYISQNSGLKNKKVFLLGTQSVEADFNEYNINLCKDANQSADIVVLALHFGMTYEQLARACVLIQKGAYYIATHDDISCPSAESGIFIPDCGSFIELIKGTTGRYPDIICGKPYSTAAQGIQRMFGLDSSQITMVGDRLHADISFGVNNGYSTVLVLTGGTKREDLADSKIQPDLVLERFSDLREYF